ncbi:phosphonate ABC transporter, permease protein PhnE [Nitrosopumilus sp.]|nr:phosphonate ABC transporter, permease protein PhnE [Nitrosopumilus sp.]
MALIVGLLVIASYNVEANPLDFVEGIPHLATIASEIFILENIVEDLKYIPTALWAMLETLQMAFIGTVIGVVVGLPLSMLSARNLNSKYVYAPTRALLAIIRTFPSILWALLFVIMVGLGPYAGVLAIVMYTIGFVTKLQYESIETIDSDPMDAVSSIGVSKFQLIRYVVLPESASHLLGQILYMFDYNVRQTSILGIVGAGGIGFFIINYIKFFEYGKAAIFLVIVLITVLIIDWISVKIRDKYIIKSQHGVEIKHKKSLFS